MIQVLKVEMETERVSGLQLTGAPAELPSDVFMHCGCAELISECQLRNGMDMFCLFRERI